jgi:hypothetical protein
MKRLTWLVVFAVAMAVGQPAHAGKAKIVWTEIAMPSDSDRPDLTRHLRDVVMRQARLVDWGRDGTVEAKIEVTEFSVVTKDAVVRVTCAGHGRFSAAQGGKVARSRFSMGGRPKDRAALERQLLTMLGRGLVTRLSQMARSSR